MSWILGVLLLAVASAGIAIAHRGGSNDLPANAKRLDSKDYARSDWPLTVASGIVRCEKFGVITFQPTGQDVRYAINEQAQGLTDLPELEPIWKRDPKNPRFRVDISPVVDPGLDLCGS